MYAHAEEVRRKAVAERKALDDECELYGIGCD